VRRTTHRVHNTVSFFFQFVAAHGVGSPQKIIQYKFLWLRLSNFTQDLGSSSGFSYGTFILLCFCGEVLSCYGSLSSMSQGMKLIHVLLGSSSICFALFLFFTCTAAHYATQEVRNPRYSYYHYHYYFLLLTFSCFAGGKAAGE
jgi:hypothetical protein